MIVKVMKAFENCIRTPKCLDCPWETCEEPNCEKVKIPRNLACTVFAMLKAQEPRVMTLEEVQTAEDCCEPVFLEMDKYLSTPDVFSWAMIKHIEPLNDKRIYVLDRPGFSSALYSEWYGVYWRCWTARPTDEQRKAVKWDDIR